MTNNEIIQKSRDLAPNPTPSLLNATELGRGGTSIVYLEANLHHDKRKKIAIKVMHKHDVINDEILINMHILDAYAAKHLKTFHSVEYLGHCIINDQIALLFEYMGCNLVEFIKSDYNDEAISCYGIDILLGIHFMHTVAKIILGDIHPKNVLVLNGKAVLADFGLSKFESDQVSKSQEIAGTPLFFAPELLIEFYSKRRFIRYSNDLLTDIWALGLTYYYMVTKQQPFKELEQLDDDNFVDAMSKKTDPIQFNEHEVKRHSLLTRLSLMACRPQRSERPTAQALLDTLHEEAKTIVCSLRRRK